MQPVARQATQINDFIGLVTNAGRSAIDQTQMASTTQVNLASVSPGELVTRPGLRPVTFDEDATS